MDQRLAGRGVLEADAPQKFNPDGCTKPGPSSQMITRAPSRSIDVHLARVRLGAIRRRRPSLEPASFATRPSFPGRGFYTPPCQDAPRKDRKARSDGRRVQGVDGIGQVQPQFSRPYSVLAWVISRWANAAWQVDTPVAPFVHRPASSAGPAGKTMCIFVDRRQVSVAQAFPVERWAKADRYCRRRKASGPGDRRHTGRRSACSPWQDAPELSEQGLAGVT